MANDGAEMGSVGQGTPEDPWVLSTPPGTSEYTMHKDWYGLKKGLRGRFGMYVPPLMEALRLAEMEHNPRNNRMRAI